MFLTSSARDDPLPAFPRACVALPLAAIPPPMSIAHPAVADYWRHLLHALAHRASFAQLPGAPSRAAYALIALSVLYRPHHPAFPVFWHLERRAHTAELVHDVLMQSDASRAAGTGALIASPSVPWVGAAHALRLLSAWERRDAEKVLQKQLQAKAKAARKRRGAERPDGGDAAGEPPVKVQRLTRAAARRAVNVDDAGNAEAGPPASTSTITAAPTMPSPAPALMPRHRPKKPVPRRPLVELTGPAQPGYVLARARSTSSEESNETLVGAQAEEARPRTRSGSVVSGITVVGAEEGDDKEKGRVCGVELVVDVAEDGDDAEGRMMTRSRTSVRAAPYPVTKAAQVGAGRGRDRKGRVDTKTTPAVKAKPTGKRKGRK
ncbi:hypothetical protein C8J57DRAFT_1460943 [Mycena rebaudengoi]|nr:hypothetical protein C8J57DRAFT_1460943 [Mycena rebaudengoi]